MPRGERRRKNERTECADVGDLLLTVGLTAEAVAGEAVGEEPLEEGGCMFEVLSVIEEALLLAVSCAVSCRDEAPGTCRLEDGFWLGGFCIPESLLEREWWDGIVCSFVCWRGSLFV